MKATPVKEIIFSLSFDEHVNESVLEAFKESPLVKEHYPITTKGFSSKMKPPAKLRETWANVSMDGYILRNEKRDKALKTKRGALSFHKLDGYDNYEQLTAELQKWWAEFQHCAGMELTVSHIKLRYLNFIPLAKEENPQDLVKVLTEHPFTSVVNALSLISFQAEDDLNTVIDVVASTEMEEGQKGIILDIILNRRVELQENKLLSDVFALCKEIKNSVFAKSITDRVIEKYK